MVLSSCSADNLTVLLTCMTVCIFNILCYKLFVNPRRACAARVTVLGLCQTSSGRSVSEAAPHYGNLCVYEHSTLWKKPSASLEETL